MDEHLTVSQRGPVVTVTMARPEVHNTFNEALFSAIRTPEEGREGVAAFLEKRKSAWAE